MCTAPEYIDERGEVIRAGQSVGYVNNKQRPNTDGGMGGSNAASVPNAIEKGSGHVNRDYTLPAGACPNCSAKSCKNKGNCTKQPYCGKHDIFGSHNVGDCVWSQNSTVPISQPSYRGNFRGGARGRGRGRGSQAGNNGSQQPQPQGGPDQQSLPPGGYAGRQPPQGNYGGVYPPVAPVERQAQGPDYSGYYPNPPTGQPALMSIPPPQGPPPQQNDQNFRS